MYTIFKEKTWGKFHHWVVLIIYSIDKISHKIDPIIARDYSISVTQTMAENGFFRLRENCSFEQIIILFSPRHNVKKKKKL